MLIYTGIGSRDTPIEIQELMTKIAQVLETKGYTLRSGGANGADLAFEKGVTTLKEIYLPWKGFNHSTSPLYNVEQAALDMAAPHHGGWTYLKDAVKKLMGRNAYQVLGQDLNTPAKFVICWTKDGVQTQADRTNKTGGTGLAISLADSLGIPVFNLNNQGSYERILAMISA